MLTMQVFSPFTLANVFSLCSMEWVFLHYIIPSRSLLF